MRPTVNLLAIFLIAFCSCARLTAPIEIKKDALFGELKNIQKSHREWKPIDFEGSVLAFEHGSEGSLALVLVTQIKGSAKVWGMARHLPVRFENYRVLRIVPKKILGTEALVGIFEVFEEGRPSFVHSVTWKQGGTLYDTLLITPKKDPKESLGFFKDLTLRVLRVSLR